MNDWTPEEDEAFNDIEKQSNLGKQILKEIKPQRTWVGLTSKDTFEIGERLGLSDIAWVDLMEAIEAKLKEKNT